TGYVGVAVLGLAAVGLAGRARRTAFLGALLLVALLMSLGDHGPLFPLVARWPVLGWGRTPVRYLALVELALALLAAFGVDALRVGRGRRTAGTAALVLAVLALAVVGATHVSGPAPDLLFGRPDPVSFAQPDTRILLATLAGAAALFTLLARRGLEDRRLLVLTLLFAAGGHRPLPGQPALPSPPTRPP